MLAIHGIWAYGVLGLWAEDPDGPAIAPPRPGRASRAPRPHPFASDPDTLADVLAGRLVPGAKVAVERRERCVDVEGELEVGRVVDRQVMLSRESQCGVQPVGPAIGDLEAALVQSIEVLGRNLGLEAEASKEDIRDLWLRHLPITQTFGPERTLLLKAGINTLMGGDPNRLDEWVSVLNPRDEQCGAMIRADAYGYACPGRPALAAEKG